jgi:hypothetical protein
MSLPNFLCVGAQKAGTTSLQGILIQHPDIYLPGIKETHFFDNGEMNYAMGLSWYESEYFSAVKNETAKGEISTNYMFLDYIPRRIYEDLGPDTKLVFMLRDPVSRAYSQYMMNRQNFFETNTFEEALALETERIQEGEYAKRIYGYALRGLYAGQILNFLKYFPKEQMFFIIFETEFLENRAQTINALCQFLKVSPYAFELGIKKNVMGQPGYKLVHKLLYDPAYAWLRKPFKLAVASEQKREWIKFMIRSLNRRKITPKNPAFVRESTREFLNQYFQEDIQVLQKLVDKDISHWLNVSKEKR